MQLLPPAQHFKSLSELRKVIIEGYENFKLPLERQDINDHLFDPEPNTFEVVINKKKEKLLIPDARHYPFLFRGERKNYSPLPTLQRGKLTETEIFVERMRQTEFEFLLKEHPVVKGFFRKHNFKIDFMGLAQHYGLKTDLLDFTSDFDIALFFAMCPYNRDEDCYSYFKQEGRKTAYLYVVLPALNFDLKKENFLESEVSVIGHQPFLRPGAQKGFSYQVRKGKPLNAVKYSFEYTSADSQKYYEKYQRGKELWIEDLLADKTKLIQSKSQFSISIFNHTCKQYLPKGTSKNKLKKDLKLLKVDISTKNENISFSPDENQNIIKSWNKMEIKKIRHSIRRRSWNQREQGSNIMKKYDFRTTSILLNMEMLRLTGNRSGIEEYLKNQKTIPNQSTKIRKDNNVTWSSGWKYIPEAYVLAKSETFLKEEDCLI